MPHSRQLSFSETLYVYKCPHGCHRYWDENPTLGREAEHGHDITLYCERCGSACRRIGSFSHNPYCFEGTFPSEEALPLPIDGEGEGGETAP